MKKKKSNIRPSVKDRQKQYRQPKEQLQKKSYADFVGLAVIMILGIIIYSNSFNCSFQFDDAKNIVNNAAIRDWSDVFALWKYSQTRFISFFTFAINYHFDKLNVWGYHLVNLSIHLVNACLIWWLTILIFSSPVLKDNPITRHKKVIAFFTALLFVSHPLATQSVTYIVQRMTSLAALFYLLSLALYIKARLTEKSNLLKYLLFIGSLFVALLAMFTKENTFTLPFAIVLVEIFFLQTKKLTLNIKDYRIIMFIGAFLSVIFFLLFIFSLNIFKPIPPSMGNTYTLTSFNYLFTQFGVIVKYLQLLVLPVHQNVDYDFPIANHFFEIGTLLCFILLAGLISLAVFFFKRYRIISFGIVWFFLTLSIESGIVPIKDVIFEHRTYLPSFGFFLILSSGICMLLWNKNKYLAISVFLILIGLNSYLTYQRNKVWKDEISLWSDTVGKSPNKVRPYNQRGLAFKNLGQWNNAIADYTKAIGINPENFIVYSNRGVAYSSLGKWDKAIEDYSRVIEIEPTFVAAYNNRGITYSKLQLWDKAIADYTEAIRIDPAFANAYFNRGSTYGNLGQLDKAIADFSEAITLDPNYAGAYYFRGNTYSNLGQWGKAIEDYSKAIAIDPKLKEAYTNRDAAYRKWRDAKKQ